MVKKYYRMFWLCFLITVAIAGCDSTKSIDPSNLQLTIVAAPTTVLIRQFCSITATLNNVDTSTSSTTTTPVSGHAVTFKITQNTSNGTLTVVNNITDASGNATAIYQAGSVAGIDIIQASIDSGQNVSSSINVTLQ